VLVTPWCFLDWQVAAQLKEALRLAQCRIPASAIACGPRNRRKMNRLSCDRASDLLRRYCGAAYDVRTRTNQARQSPALAFMRLDGASSWATFAHRPQSTTRKPGPVAHRQIPSDLSTAKALAAVLASARRRRRAARLSAGPRHINAHPTSPRPFLPTLANGYRRVAWRDQGAGFRRR